MKKKFLKIYLFILVIILFINSTKIYTILNNIYFRNRYILFFYSLFLIVYGINKYKLKLSFSKKFIKHFFLFFYPFNIIISLFIYFFELSNYHGFVLSHFAISPFHFLFFSIFINLFFFLNLSQDWKKNVLFISISIISFFCLIRVTLPTFFLEFIREDSYAEYLTFILFIFSSIISLKLGTRVRTSPLPKLEKFCLQLIYFSLAIGCFLIAGEEISWGQRIFNIKTPVKIAETNLQGEITLHNQQSVFTYVYIAYKVIALYGSIAWIFLYLFKKYNKNQKLNFYASLFIPPYFTSPLFIPQYIYVRLRVDQIILKNNLWQYIDSKPEIALAKINNWEELVEMFLSAGILIFLIYSYQNFDQCIFKLKKNK